MRWYLGGRGPVAYSGYMEAGVQLLMVGGGRVLTVDTRGSGPAAYSGYIGAGRPACTWWQGVQLLTVGT